MSIILNLETSSNICSVNLSESGKSIHTVQSQKIKDHSALLTRNIEKVCKHTAIKLANIDAVAISEGPGSYTGLRIGTSTAKGICYALNIPLIGVGSLEALTWKCTKSFPGHTYYSPLIKSRKNEVYTAKYDADINPVTHPMSMNINEIVPEENTIYFSNFFEDFHQTFKDLKIPVIETIEHAAENMQKLSYDKFCNKVFKNLIYFEPLYLKDVYFSTKTNS
jgi:tRNA threonylcarbamoyladenosine biosynthesis protein TsaB